MGKWVTAEGFLMPTLEEILQDYKDDWHDNISPYLDVSVESPEGQMIAILASHTREVLEVAAIAYNINPRDVEGAILEDVSALTGTSKKGATRSVFRGLTALRAELEDGTTIPVDSRVHVNDHPETQFRVTKELVNSSGITATFDLEAEAMDLGPITAYADTVQQIATPINGWLSVNNPTDVQLGENEESDAELRVRRERELRKPGSSSAEAVAVDVGSIKYNGLRSVEESRGFENDTDFFDARGMPPHSIEILLYDGPTPTVPDNVIAQAIMESRAGGIKTFGTSSGIALTELGEEKVQYFSRPTTVPFGFEILATCDPTKYAGDVEFARIVADAMKSKARSEMLVRHSDVTAACYTVPGITGVQSVRLFDFAYPAFTDFQMGLRRRPLFDSGDVVFAVTPG